MSRLVGQISSTALRHADSYVSLSGIITNLERNGRFYVGHVDDLIPFKRDPYSKNVISVGHYYDASISFTINLVGINYPFDFIYVVLNDVIPRRSS